jgi:hypothetical protein
MRRVERLHHPRVVRHLTHIRQETLEALCLYKTALLIV